MQLPPPLAPWRHILQWFDEDIAATLGALLLRLQPLLGPSTAPQHSGAIEPDGIDDLRRRGSYERLLLSEWAMADAAPDEFLRRAAAGEHLFLHPRRVQPRGNPQIVALFDCGPLQLGAPRLVQLALALLLARRAERQGARFGWASLQEPAPFAPLAQASDLKSLLLQRSLLPAGDDAIATWQSTLQALPAAAECWLVGGAPARLPGTHRVSLQQRLGGSVALEIAGRHGRRQALLDPPPSAVGARLLRGEFVALSVASTPARKNAGNRFGLAQPPRLDRDGKRVLLPLLGSAGLLQIRQSTRVQGRVETSTLRWREGASLLAPLMLPRGGGGLLSHGTHLRGWQLDPFKRLDRPAPEELNTAPGQGRWLETVLLDPGCNTARLLLLDHAGNLADWYANDSSRPSALTRSVLALHAASSNAAIVVRVESAQLQLLRISNTQAREVMLRVATPQPARTAFLAGGIARNHHWEGTCAYSAAVQTPPRDSGSWKFIYCGNGRFTHGEASLPPNAQPFGLAVEPEAPQRHALIGLHADRRQVLLYLPQPLTIYTSDVVIKQAAVCASGARIALLTQQRELLLIDVATQQVLLHVQGAA